MTLSLFGTFLSRFKLFGWLKCAGQVFNVPGNVALGAVYHFFDEATTASLNLTKVFMMGYFNAHIGDLSEFTDENYDIQDDFKCLQHARLTCCKPVNRASKLLLDIAAAGPYMLTTGRGKGEFWTGHLCGVSWQK